MTCGLVKGCTTYKDILVYSNWEAEFSGMIVMCISTNRHIERVCRNLFK